MKFKIFLFIIINTFTVIYYPQSKVINANSKTYIYENNEYYSISNNKKYHIVKEEIVVKPKNNIVYDSITYSNYKLPYLKEKNGNNIHGYKVLNIPKDQNLIEIISKLNEMQVFEKVEHSFYGKYHDNPNDEYFVNNSQWNLNTINLPKSWQISKGVNNTKVAVIGGGVSFNHEDLVNQLNSSYKGWNYATNDENPIPYADHETHCAGIIAASTNNTLGISGIAGGWSGGGIKMLYYQCQPDQYNAPTSTNVISAINDAVTNGAKIISISMGGFEETEYFNNAIQSAYNNNVILCISSGNYLSNDQDDPVVEYPASHLNVISIGASIENDHAKELGDQTNESYWGNRYLGHLDLLAPGIHIPTTHIIGWQQPKYISNFNGTSAAAPHVAGVVALILSIKSNLTVNQVKNILQNSCYYNSDFMNLQKYGWGRLDAYKALKYTLENYGGTIGGTGETVTFTENITVASGKTLTVKSGTTVKFTNNAMLVINGNLSVQGTSTSNVIFDFIGPSSSNGIKVNAGGIATINYAEIKNAYNGVYLDNSASTIANCKIHNCTYGIKTNYNTPTIETNKIYDNSYGIYAYQGTPKITDNYIFNIAGYGITINGSTNTFIRKNTLSYCHGGIYAYGNQSIKLRGYLDYSYGLNLIQNYYSEKAVYITGGTADLGDYGSYMNFEGQNSIIKNYTPVIVNSTSNQILAEKNYWNGTPQSSWFVGSISYIPFLSSPHTSAGSTIDKIMGIEQDKLLLAEASELSDMKSLVSSSEKFKQLIAEYPESKYAGLALAWDMSLNKSEGNLYSQKEYLMNNIKHKNNLVRDNSLLWLETLHAEAGEVKEAENIVQLTSPEEIIGTEIRLNFANDLLNLYNEKEKAEEVFNDILKYNKSDDIDYTINVIKEMSNYSENNLKNIQNLSKNIEIDTEELPNEYELFSNYPNPFNPTTKIKYNLPFNSKVEITIYDIMGREVKRFNDISNTSGSYEQEWNGTNNYGEKVASGIYLMKFSANSIEGNNKTYSKTLKLTLLK